MDELKAKIRTIPDWPEKGVMFRDITTLLKDAEAFQKTIDMLSQRYKNQDIDIIAGIESRGFIIGSALADRLGIGFIPIRKKGKLPSKVISEEYKLEYGTASIEMHEDAVKSGTKVLLIDDVIATGGTAVAACQLIPKLKGSVVECGFIIGLPALGGMRKLEENGERIFTLMTY